MDDKMYAVVLRFASLYPSALKRVLMHARRTGGDLDNVEMGFSDRNRLLAGPEDFAKAIRAEIRAMSRANRDAEVAALRRQKRTRQAEARHEEGLLDPWKSSDKGPIREVILTAKVDYFHAVPDAPDDEVMITYGQDDKGRTIEHRLCRKKIDQFQEYGTRFFEEHFPGAVRHLRLDLDEESAHFHAVVMQVIEKTSGRRGTQRLIQPSANPLLADYEHAQDVAGAHFAPIGLTRGEKRAEATRQAKEAGEKVEAAPEHVTPREKREARWRAIFDKEVSAETTHQSLTVQTLLVEGERAEAIAKTKKAQEAIERADAREASAEILMQAMTAGVDAVMDRVLEYRPANQDKAEGLVYGPLAPREEPERAQLRSVIGPAYDWLLGFARKVFKINVREDEQDQVAVELRRQAGVLAEAERKAGRPVAPALDQIAVASPVVYDEGSFPEAFAVRLDMKQADLRRTLDAMDNRTVCARHRASHDAVRLCDEDTDLRSRFSRGVSALSLAAEERGLDLATGRHDPERATDPSRARIHTDVGEVSIRVLRPADAERQRTRSQ